MQNTHYISSQVIDIQAIMEIIDHDKKLALSDEAILNINKCRDYLDTKLANNNTPIYGINTGFGSLCTIKISNDHLEQLQENLVVSHACGTGEPIPHIIIKLMIILKVQSLSYGYSGVQLKTVERLIDFYNSNILPVVYSQGSLGASGDLAPLAHLSLPLIGKGEVYYKNAIKNSSEVLEKMGWKPLKLKAKEGLALLNGTQFMSAFGMYLLMKSYKLSYFADLISAISIDAFECSLSPFDQSVHEIRPHRGQIKTAQNIREFLIDSQLASLKKDNVQDPYSFRCIPQVHGATKDSIGFVYKTLKTEINSVTDNPNIFIEEDTIVSGGNFHGQPLALALDYLSIAMSELGSISERRVYQLISGLRGLPAFLVSNPGLNSGLMIPQYTAASIVSQNKQLASPASIDSIVSSNGQEDHVSMGANAATKCYKIIENIETLLAIELLTASQAITFRNPFKSSDFIESFLKEYRKGVPFISEDRILYKDIEKSKLFIEGFEIDYELLFDF